MGLTAARQPRAPHPTSTSREYDMFVRACIAAGRFDRLRLASSPPKRQGPALERSLPGCGGSAAGIDSDLQVRNVICDLRTLDLDRGPLLLDTVCRRLVRRLVVRGARAPLARRPAQHSDYNSPILLRPNSTVRAFPKRAMRQSG